MATKDLKCKKCGKVFEHMFMDGEDEKKDKPRCECGGRTEVLVSAPRMILFDKQREA